MNTFLTILMLPLLVLTCQQDKKATFEKIIFHTTGCFGNCPTYHLQIDNDKTAMLYAEHVYKNNERPFVEDSTKTGYYKGKIDDATFQAIMEELKTIGLDTLTFDNVTCCDGPVKTLIIYYNGKRKFLKSMIPPPQSKKLLSVLYTFCTANELKKTEEKFAIESDSAEK